MIVRCGIELLHTDGYAARRGPVSKLSLCALLLEYADKYKFWASKCTPGMEMRKIHTGLPALIVRTLTAITLADMNDFDFENETHGQIWKEIGACAVLPV